MASASESDRERNCWMALHRDVHGCARLIVLEAGKQTQL